MASMADPRWIMIHRLQKRRDRHPVGSYQHEMADKAIDLLLSDRRCINDFGAENALAHARFIDARRRRRRRTVEWVSFDEEKHWPAGRLSATGIDPAADSESYAIGVDLARKIGIGVTTEHRLGLDCLIGLCEGLSQTELADRLQVSSAQASILRMRVRNVAANVVAS